MLGLVVFGHTVVIKVSTTSALNELYHLLKEYSIVRICQYWVFWKYYLIKLELTVDFFGGELNLLVTKTIVVGSYAFDSWSLPVDSYFTNHDYVFFLLSLL